MSGRGIVMIAAVAIAVVAISAAISPIPRLIWNASPSVPVGLYAVHRLDALHVGDLVAVRPPPALSTYMAVRHYLPLGLPLLKHVAAIVGDTICRQDRTITINGAVAAEALIRDSHARLLPDWQGCRQLRAGQVLLLNPAVPDSFDGRYFGVLSAQSLLGRAIPLIVVAGP